MIEQDPRSPEWERQQNKEFQLRGSEPIADTPLLSLLQAMRDDPDNLSKQVIYFKALADARLDDYYAKSDDLTNSEIERRKVEGDYAKLCHAVVGANCHVDHAIETLTEQRKSQKIMYDALTAIAYGTELAWLKSYPDVRTTFDSSSRRVASIARANAVGIKDEFDDPEVCNKCGGHTVLDNDGSGIRRCEVCNNLQ